MSLEYFTLEETKILRDAVGLYMDFKAEGGPSDPKLLELWTRLSAEISSVEDRA